MKNTKNQKDVSGDTGTLDYTPNDGTAGTATNINQVPEEVLTPEQEAMKAEIEAYMAKNAGLFKLREEMREKNAQMVIDYNKRLDERIANARLRKQQENA